FADRLDAAALFVFTDRRQFLSYMSPRNRGFQVPDPWMPRFPGLIYRWEGTMTINGCGLLLRLCLVITGLLVLTINAAAQIGRGSLTGAIADSSGAAVPRASISITHTETGANASTLSGGTGNYYFPNLVPGTYLVEVGAPGFRDHVQHGITVSVGD